MKKSKRIEGLDCEAPVREAAGFALRAKLELMFALRDAALDFSDIEGVHKMRVASRRLRSALRDFRPYLARPVSTKKLRAVARALGAVRDEDVAIEMIERLAAEVGDDTSAGVERIAIERRERRVRARAKLRTAIGDAALWALRERFDAHLHAATKAEKAEKAERVAEDEAADDGGGAADGSADSAADGAGDDSADSAADSAADGGGDGADDGAAEGAGVSVADGAADDDAEGAARRTREPRFADVGGEIVRARFAELRKSASSLCRPFGVEELHETRIKAKRLRYAVELFSQCWGRRVEPFAAEVAQFQEHLGLLHDCDVWIDDLGARLKRLAKKRPRASTRAAADRRAAARLLAHFTEERTRHYNSALALWEHWEESRFESRLAAAIKGARADRRRVRAQPAGQPETAGGEQAAAVAPPAVVGPGE